MLEKTGEKMKPIYILLPALNPAYALINYVQNLLKLTNESTKVKIVVVNDGSDKKHIDLFQKLEYLEGVKVLNHEVNRGKGCALKTGFQYIKTLPEEVAGIITADSDGQHGIEDVKKMRDRILDGGVIKRETMCFGCEKL